MHIFSSLRRAFNIHSRDVYLNVAGGLRISEPSSDLAVAVAVVSSMLSLPLQPGVALIGELGLGGELRGGRQLEVRIAEATKLGFTKLVVPRSTGRRSSSFKTSSSKSTSPATTVEKADIKKNFSNNAILAPNQLISSSSSTSTSTSRETGGTGRIIACSTLLEALTEVLTGDIKHALQGRSRRHSVRDNHQEENRENKAKSWKKIPDSRLNDKLIGGDLRSDAVIVDDSVHSLVSGLGFRSRGIEIENDTVDFITDVDDHEFTEGYSDYIEDDDMVDN